MPPGPLRRPHVAALAAAGLCALTAPAADAQVTTLGEWDGRVSTEASVLMQRTAAEGADTTRQDSSSFLEQISLANTDASIMDPRILRFSIGGTAGLTQERLDLSTGTAARDGTLGSYDLFVGVLPENATSLRLFASRQESVITRELAGRSDVLGTHHGLTISASRLPLPSTITFERGTDEEATRVGDLLTHRDQRRTSLTYDGQRGWMNQDVSIRYRRLEEMDRVLSALSYSSHDLQLAHGIDFGPELNRHMDSRLTWLNRSGSSPLTALTLDERLGLEHTDRLQSEWRYFMTDTTAAGARAASHTAGMSVQHRLYESLTTTFDGSGTLQLLPNGEKHIGRSRVNAAYTKRLPRNGVLSADVGGGMELERDAFDAVTTIVPQEMHTVDGVFALPLLLRNVFVSTSTVAITKTAFGPLPPGCLTPSGPPTPLVLGRDYTLRQVGDLTQVVPVACSATVTGINPGDTIAADYAYDVAQSQTFTTASWHSSLSADYGWIRPYAAHTQSVPQLLSGASDAFLTSERSDVAGLELRFAAGPMRAGATGQVGQAVTGDLRYNSLQGTQLLTAALAPELTLHVNADQTYLVFTEEARNTLTLREQATLTYVPWPNLLIELVAGLRRLIDTLFQTERITESALRLRWLIGGFEVLPSLSWLSRQRGATETQELQAMVRMSRRF